MKKLIITSAIATLAFVSVAAASFDANLSVGSMGADVSMLQAKLISAGFDIPAISSNAAAAGYFGQQTKAAVIAYQKSVNVPTTGFVGPLTRAALNGSAPVVVNPGFVCPTGMTCTVNPGSTNGTPSTGALMGTDGTIDTVSELSQYNNEEVGDGENDVKVAGFEIETSNDGDIALKSMKIEFNGALNSGSTRLKDYVESVSIWKGSTKIGSASAADFSESNDVYTKTVALNSGVVVKSDTTEKFYITVDAVNNLDSGDISGSNDQWSVDLLNVRYEDGAGVVTTEDSITDLDVAISFVSFATAADTELKISKDSSSPTEVVVIDETDNTDDVTLLVGKIQVKGTSDITVDEIPVTLTTVGPSTVTLVTGSITLKIDGEEYTESVGTAATTGTTTFNNLDLTLTAGKTYTFTVTADINDVDAGFLDEGDTIKAEVTATNVDYVDAENEEGDQLADNTEKTGTALGDELALYSEGINVTLKSVSASVDADGTTTNNDTGTFTITYTIKSFGDTVYLSDTGTATTSTTIPDATLASGGNRFLLDIGGTASTSALSTGVSFSKVGGAEDSTNGNIELADGETTDITLTVSRTNTSVYANGGLMKVLLKAILWNTDDSASTFNVYDFDLEDYDTSNTSKGGKLVSVN